MDGGAVDGPAVDGGARGAHDVVVYGAGWCPDVRRSRALLDGAGVPYRYVDVEADPRAEALVRELQRGPRRIPTLVRADGAHLVEPTDPELRTWLGLAPA